MPQRWSACYPPRAVGLSISGIVISRAQSRREAWVLRTGNIELADVLSGYIRVRAHIYYIDAVNMVGLLKVLRWSGRLPLPGNVGLTQSRLISHEKASGRIGVAIQAPRTHILPSPAENRSEMNCVRLLSSCVTETASNMVRRASRTGSHTSSHPGGSTATPTRTDPAQMLYDCSQVVD